MKKSELRNIIRETLSNKMMLNEGPACDTSNNIAGSGNSNTGGADFNSDCTGQGNLGPTQRGVCVTAPPNNMGASHHCCYSPTCLDGIGGGPPGTPNTGLDLEVDPFNPYNKFNPDPRAQAPDNKINKKSQLRNIIRESIKQLMNEQSNTGILVSSITCPTSGSPTTGIYFCHPDPNVQIGDVMQVDGMGMSGWGGPATLNHDVYIDDICYPGSSGCLGISACDPSAQNISVSPLQGNYPDPQNACHVPTPINPPIDTMDPNMAPAEFTSVSPSDSSSYNPFKGDDLEMSRMQDLANIKRK
jgi:hypothetical protein